MTGIKITETGVVSIVEITSPAYKSLQAEIGGYIEIVRPVGLPQPFCMIVDEEGRCKNKPFNIVGSYLYGFHKHGEPIVGDVVIMKEVDTEEGADLDGLAKGEILIVMSLLSRIK